LNTTRPFENTEGRLQQLTTEEHIKKLRFTFEQRQRGAFGLPNDKIPNYDKSTDQMGCKVDAMRKNRGIAHFRVADASETKNARNNCSCGSSVEDMLKMAHHSDRAWRCR
jgi:hypothetical protein